MVIPELQYPSRSDQQGWGKGFSVMIAHLHLLGGLIYQLTNVRMCVRSVLKEIRLPKKPK